MRTSLIMRSLCVICHVMSLGSIADTNPKDSPLTWIVRIAMWFVKSGFMLCWLKRNATLSWAFPTRARVFVHRVFVHALRSSIHEAKNYSHLFRGFLLLLCRFAEKAVLAHFILLALLWLFRDPKFIKGWAIIFEKE